MILKRRESFDDSPLVPSFLVRAHDVTYCSVYYPCIATFPHTPLIPILTTVIVFQILVCLWVYCSGISIVWCAMGGWIVSERKRLRLYDPQTPGEHLFRRFSVVAEMFVVFIDISIIVYYAFVTPWYTTIAHVMSLVLGATLSLISIKRYDEDHGQSMESATPATPLMM